jgi:predicted phosphohydrolase
MKVFAIGDLHLSGGTDKPMDVFGPAWQNHGERIANAWMDSVSQEDVVLLPGDFSWAMQLSQAKADMEWLAALPGTKLMIRGNHDYGGIPSHRSGSVASFHVCAAERLLLLLRFACRRYTGVDMPGSAVFSTDDQKIYDREVLRLGLSLPRCLREGVASPCCTIRPLTKTARFRLYRTVGTRRGRTRCVRAFAWKKLQGRV